MALTPTGSKDPTRRAHRLTGSRSASMPWSSMRIRTAVRSGARRG